MCVHQDRLFMGVNSDTVSGVWSFNPRNRVLVLEYRLSTGTYANSGVLRVSSLLSVDASNLQVGWYDNTASKGGIDSTVVSTGVRYSSYAAYLISPFFQVGTPLQKRTFHVVEFELADALATGQGVRMSYRTLENGSFTTIGTFDHTTYGAVKSLSSLATIPLVDAIQLKVELTTGSNMPATPELRSVKLR